MINASRTIAVSMLLALVSPQYSFGQASPAPRKPTVALATDGVEGDVYLVMKNGDTKRGAGRTISLLRDTPQLRIALDSACSRYHSTWRALRDSLDTVHKTIVDSREAAHKALLSRISDPSLAKRWQQLSRHSIAYHDTVTSHQLVLQATTEVQVRTILRSATADTVGTGMNAHYTFARVRAGTYILFGEWTIGDNHYQWWAPITVVAGKPLQRDLDNSVEADDKVYCGIR
jgi:hypothetical protein